MPQVTTLDVSIENVWPPATAVGAVITKFVVSSIPSWPPPFTPQQYATPAIVRPQVFANPATMVLNWRPPTTATGLRRMGQPPGPNSEPVAVPSPSCPEKLPPQQ